MELASRHRCRQATHLLHACSALHELLTKLELGPSQARIDTLHALFVGLLVIDLATSRRNGKARAKAALETAFVLLAADAAGNKEHLPRLAQ
jgi:hypothetical protein